MTDQESRSPRSGPVLEGTRWQLRFAIDAEGALAPVPEGVLATARFEDGRLFGSGGCNRYSASYTLDGSRLTLGPAASTMMACPDPAGTFENTFYRALSTTATWEVDGQSLILRDGDDRSILVFRAVVEPPLTGTEWSATAVNNGTGGVASLVASTAITAIFAEEGLVSGSGGCNRYTGPFTTDGSRVSIGPLATTRMACPAPVMEQEGQYLGALGRATTWRIDGDALELRDDEGALQASFRTREPGRA